MSETSVMGEWLKLRRREEREESKQPQGTMSPTVFVEEVERCSYAERFDEWCRQLLSDNAITDLRPGEEGDTLLNQVLLRLQDGFFAHRTDAPYEHQESQLLGNHECVFAVYVRVYKHLKNIQLRRVPPPIIVKHKPKPKPVPPVKHVYEDIPLEESDERTDAAGSGEI